MDRSRLDWTSFSAEDIVTATEQTTELALVVQEHILSIALSTPAQFAQGVVDVLKEDLHLEAATMFTKSRGLQAFRLKAASGFRYSDYQSFLLHNPSYPSMACEDPSSVLWALSPLDNKLFANWTLLEGREITGTMVVPFRPPDLTDDFYPDPMGALCLYPSDSSVEWDDLFHVAIRLQRLVGTLYLAALDRLCMQLRERAVGAAAFQQTLGGTCEKLIALFCEELQFEAGSIWLLNPRRQQLLLRAAWPGLRNPKAKIADHQIRLEYSANPIANSFRSGQQVHHPKLPNQDGGTRTYAHFEVEKIPEDYGDTFSNTFAVPMATPHDVKLGHLPRAAVGVITLTNKYVELGGVRHSLPTTWEDIKIVNYLTEITTVMVYQGLLASDHESDYERRIHGLKINLIATRNNLQQLEDRAALSSLRFSRQGGGLVGGCDVLPV